MSMRPVTKKDGLRWNQTHSAERLKELAAGKTIVVFGGTKGLGRAIADSLVDYGAKQVVVVGRTLEDEANLPLGLTFKRADLSLLKTCQTVVDDDQEFQSIVKKADHVVFTAGIMATSKRKETAEKVELDMAVSYLSRLVIIQKLIGMKNSGQLNPAVRLWVMGFPGPKNIPANVDDLNAEKNYSLFAQHMHTVVGNECIVHYYKNQIAVFGLNPGLIKTGIRTNVLGQGMMKTVVEGLIGLFNISAAKYGSRVARLMLSPELEGKSGLLFNQSLEEINANVWCTEQNVNLFIGKSNEVVQKAIGL